MQANTNMNLLSSVQTKESENEHEQTFCVGVMAWLACATVAPASAKQQQQPNILVIMGDDIRYRNVSAYNRGRMGYPTLNSDRIANEGAIFTETPGSRARCLRAARISALPTIAAAFAGRRVMRSRSTLPQAMSASDASPERGPHHE
jgi:Sulfatase